jgi:hypothetical protein
MTKIPLTHANIIQILGIESLPLDDRKAIVEEATNLVEAETFNRVMEKLDEADGAELVQALEKKDDDAIVNIFSKNQINILEISEAEAEKVKQEMVKVAKSV